MALTRKTVDRMVYYPEDLFDRFNRVLVNSPVKTPMNKKVLDLVEKFVTTEETIAAAEIKKQSKKK